ncbi:Single-stranded DNA-binding protein why1, chloroplastic [Cymbomonas tetramitiformis]|uniref:Single-stranded DNA-binding protein why1, chloroplastic n=1 Tax=Cymbomonas tetramitiformis TaxID=36881 RepID=A0AAE0FS60_9CHLO|nr:Single-stranded DNA-binding protein why1, chloroplastic [Cymbomonas tetramitiformis]
MHRVVGRHLPFALNTCTRRCQQFTARHNSPFLGSVRSCPPRKHLVLSSQRIHLETFATFQNNEGPTVGFAQEKPVFVNFHIYKGKGAIAVGAIKPKFAHTQGGAQMLEKPGCMLLEFAPAIGERQYDWSKKQTFSLSPVEAGDIMENAKEGCQFYHDPNKGRSGEGSITKQLSISRTPDGKGFFFQLVVNMPNRSGAGNQSTSQRVSVPVSNAEYATLKSLFNFMIPHLLGFGVFINPFSNGEGQPTNQSGTSVPPERSPSGSAQPRGYEQPLHKRSGPPF